MYAFDPKLEAVSTLKERWVWSLFMGMVFFLLYGAANQLAYLTEPHTSMFMEWEKSIPFIPFFIIPYMSSDIMFIAAFLLPYRRFELRILAARVLFIILISVLIFILFPLKFGFEKPPADSFAFLFHLLQADLPFNQLPSLHISFAIVLWASMRQHIRKRFYRFVIAAWFLLIVLSTLLVYQHHFIDLPTGAMVGLMAVYIIREDKVHFFTTQFTTPRSLKMGLYYLVGAITALLAAFIFPVFLWLFISLFTVSIVYAFGLNTLLAGKNPQANFWHWMIFLPYFLGNYLSWYYYKKRLALMAQVSDGVYFGRFPTLKEYEQIKAHKMSYIINLAPEQQLQKTPMQQKRLPFLDQTIQAPEALHKGVMLIEANRSKGVYVHCALGLSRSVSLISAWLLYKGYTIDEVNARMQTIRKGYVKSPYMKITLELYLAYLKSLN